MRVVAGTVLTLMVVTGCSSIDEEPVTVGSSASATPELETPSTEPQPSKTRDARSSQHAKREAARKVSAKRAVAAAAVRQAGRRYAVLDVVDGDTVRVDYRGGVSVRVIGIDTPETVSPSVPDECGGRAASIAAGRMLTGKSVALTFDPTQDRADRYGRPLVYLAVPGVGDFGRAMIWRGHAAEYTYDAAYRRQAGYRSAEGAARRAERGLWGACGGPDKPLRAPARAASGTGAGCAGGYRPCVPPFPPDKNCDDVNGPIKVTGSDPHELDSDGDGVACES